MNKIILLLTLIGTSILLILGITSPNDPIMWVASTSAGFTVLRLFLLASLSILLLTKPPRNAQLRLILGSFISLLTAWTLVQTYNDNMKVLDCLTLLSFCASAGIDVLEPKHRKLSVGKYPLTYPMLHL